MDTQKEKRWSHAEIDYLHEFVGSQSVAILATHLKRPVESVQAMMSRFGLEAKKGATQKKYFCAPWTAQEDKYLSEQYAAGRTAKQISADLGTRTWMAIVQRAQILNVQSGLLWTAEQDAYLIANLSTKTNAELAQYFDRSETGIQHRMKRLGINRTREQINALNKRAWTKQEDQYLVVNYLSLSYRQIAVELGRSIGAVKCRRAELDLNSSGEQVLDSRRVVKVAPGLAHYKDWTESDLQYLRGNYLTKTKTAIARHLGRSSISVIEKSKKLGLVTTPQMRRTRYESSRPETIRAYHTYTPDEDQFIRANWENKSKEEIGKALGLSKDSVIRRGVTLGLRGATPKQDVTPPKRIDIRDYLHMAGNRMWTEQEDQYLRDNWATKTRRQLAEDLDRPSLSSIGHRARLLGIAKKTEEEVQNIRFSVASMPESLVLNWISHDPALQNEFKKYPQLVRLKQGEILLKRAIRKHSN